MREGVGLVPQDGYQVEEGETRHEVLVDPQSVALQGPGQDGAVARWPVVTYIIHRRDIVPNFGPTWEIKESESNADKFYKQKPQNFIYR